MTETQVSRMVQRALLVGAAVLMTSGEARSQDGCTLVCPADIMTVTMSDMCSAVVNYSAPDTIGECGTITCVPPSGDPFQLGETTVTCIEDGEGETCDFKVTVVDQIPPIITCPENIDVPTHDPPAVVTYPAPIIADNCPGLTVDCEPPSGSPFGLGETEASCTATDTSGNTAACNFLVRVRLQQDVPAVGGLGLALLGLALAALGAVRRARRGAP